MTTTGSHQAWATAGPGVVGPKTLAQGAPLRTACSARSSARLVMTPSRSRTARARSASPTLEARGTRPATRSWRGCQFPPDSFSQRPRRARIISAASSVETAGSLASSGRRSRRRARGPLRRAARQAGRPTRGTGKLGPAHLQASRRRPMPPPSAAPWPRPPGSGAPSRAGRDSPLWPLGRHGPVGGQVGAPTRSDGDEHLASAQALGLAMGHVSAGGSGSTST